MSEELSYQAQIIISTIKDSIKVNYNEEITILEISKIVKKLPNEIIADGYQWGFDDSVVRDNVWSFVKDNYKSILKFK